MTEQDPPSPRPQGKRVRSAGSSEAIGWASVVPRRPSARTTAVLTSAAESEPEDSAPVESVLEDSAPLGSMSEDAAPVESEPEESASTDSEPEKWEPEKWEPERWEPEDPAPTGTARVEPAAGDRAPAAPAAMVSAPVRTRTPGVAWRSVPRWVYLAVVAVPVLALVVYNLVAASGGGSAKMGETFTHDSGLTLGVTGLQQYRTADRSAVGPGEQAYQVVVAVNNKTSDVIPASAVAISAMVNGAPATAVPLDGPLNQDVEPGVQLNIPFRFKVRSGTTGAVQVSVETPSEKPVYFTATI